MSYCFEILDSNFTIRKKNLPDALNALIDYERRCMEEARKRFGNNYYQQEPNYCLTFGEELRKRYDWSVEYNSKTGDVDCIWFEGDRLGDEEDFFDAIAPFVEKDSYIAVIGEDNCVWAWYFDGKHCVDCSGNIYFTRPDGKQVNI